jgi:hypothetical protein
VKETSVGPIETIDEYLESLDLSAGGADTVMNIAEGTGLTEPQVIAAVEEDQRPSSTSERHYVVSDGELGSQSTVTLNTGGRRYGAV